MSKISYLEAKVNEFRVYVQEEDFGMIEQFVDEINRIIESYDNNLINRDEFGKEYDELQVIKDLFRRIVKENDIENEEFDIDSTYDMMFPNRNDDDFDEESMSYDSVFGSD